MSEPHTPSWRDVLLLIGGSIAISIGCSWAISLVIADAMADRGDKREQHLSREIDSINDRLNARWRDLDEGPPDGEPTD